MYLMHQCVCLRVSVCERERDANVVKPEAAASTLDVALEVGKASHDHPIRTAR